MSKLLADAGRKVAKHGGGKGTTDTAGNTEHGGEGRREEEGTM